MLRACTLLATLLVFIAAFKASHITFYPAILNPHLPLQTITWKNNGQPTISFYLRINATNLAPSNTSDIADLLGSMLSAFHYSKQRCQRQPTRHSNSKHTNHAITIFSPTTTHYQMPKQPPESSCCPFSPSRAYKPFLLTIPSTLSPRKMSQYESTNKIQKQVQLPSALETHSNFTTAVKIRLHIYNTQNAWQITIEQYHCNNKTIAVLYYSTK